MDYAIPSLWLYWLYDLLLWLYSQQNLCFIKLRFSSVGLSCILIKFLGPSFFVVCCFLACFMPKKLVIMLEILQLSLEIVYSLWKKTVIMEKKSSVISCTFVLKLNFRKLSSLINMLNLVNTFIFTNNETSLSWIYDENGSSKYEICVKGQFHFHLNC